MALREIRASWQRLLFFFVCIAIGVASIVAIRSVIQSVRAAPDARGAGADSAPTCVVQSNSPLTPSRARSGSSASSAPAASAPQSEAIEIATMVRPAIGGRALQDGGAARRAAAVSALRHA